MDIQEPLNCLALYLAIIAAGTVTYYALSAMVGAAARRWRRRTRNG